MNWVIPFTAFGLADIGQQLFVKKPIDNAEESPPVSSFEIPARFLPQAVGVFNEGRNEVGYPLIFKTTEGDKSCPIAMSLNANYWDVNLGSVKDSVQVLGGYGVDRVPYKF